ncbi:DUF4145 domain-containing protein [Photobacterium damselae subsp. piscicida]|nr:DUF4145 domain-containing protein [Photobacterium damselae subsp. piscicida]
MSSSNFDFLQGVNDTLYIIALSAERNLHQDPHTTLFKVRLLSEEIVNYISELVKLDEGLSTFEQLKQLGNKGYLDEERQAIFHALRKHGNKAAHGYYNNATAAGYALEIAHKAATIYYRVKTGDGSFKPNPYQAPSEQQNDNLIEQSNEEIARLNAIIDKLESQKSPEFDIRQAQIAFLEAKDNDSLNQAQARIRELEQQLQQQASLNTEPEDEAKASEELKQRIELLKHSHFDLNESQTRFIID